MPVIEVDVSRLVEGEAPVFDSRAFRDAMGQFATGVVVVSTEFEDHTHAMTANAFMSGSLEPPLILVSVARTAKMHDRIREARTFAVSVLAHEQLFISNHFAGKPCADRVPRFERLSGMAVVEGAAVQVSTELRHEYTCGDHTLFVGLVTALRIKSDPKPLLFHRGRYAELAQPGTGPLVPLDGFWGNNELWW